MFVFAYTKIFTCVCHNVLNFNCCRSCFSLKLLFHYSFAGTVNADQMFIHLDLLNGCEWLYGK